MLREKQPTRVTSNNYTKKMVEVTKISHGKFGAKQGDDVVEKSLGRGNKYDIIHIEKSICSVRGSVMNEEGKSDSDGMKPIV
jgi:hypothetical protein